MFYIATRIIWCQEFSVSFLLDKRMKVQLISDERYCCLKKQDERLLDWVRRQKNNKVLLVGENKTSYFLFNFMADI